MKQRETSEVSLLLTDDKEIQNLNKHYRNIDSSTDVLVFSLVEGQEQFYVKDGLEEYLLGDIVISIETAQRQAKHFGHSLEHELTILLIHGLLHLLGFDHTHEDDAKKMQFEEKRILQHMKDKIYKTK